MLSSVFSLTNFILPSYSPASSSTRGETMRQGPHQGAQKSTSTGSPALRTSSSNVASVTSAGLGILSSLVLSRAGLFSPGALTSLRQDGSIPHRGMSMEKRSQAAQDTKTDTDALLARLRPIRGQIRGIHRMVAEDRVCEDVLTQ